MLALLTVLAMGCSEDIRKVQTGSLQLTPASVFFPKVADGDRVDRFVQIDNVGTGPLFLADIDAQLGEEFNVYWFLGTDPESEQRVGIEYEAGERHHYFPRRIQVLPNESITLVISYRGVGDAVPNGYLHLETNDSRLADNPAFGAEHIRDVDDDGAMELVIPIAGDRAVGEIFLSPRSLDFGRVSAGDARAETVVGRNIGQETVHLSRIHLDGSSAFTFEIEGTDPEHDPSVLQDPDGDGVPGVAPNGTWEMTVFYDPAVQAPDSGEIHVISDAVVTDVTLNLMGNGDMPCIQVNPGTLEFEAEMVGRTRVGSLSIESCGTRPLRIEEIVLTEGADVFSLVEASLPPLPAQLPGVDPHLDPFIHPQRAIQVAFNPLTESISNGRLIVRSNDPEFPLVEVPLLGRGVHNECPLAAVAEEVFTLRPLDVVTLDGSMSIDSDGPDGRPVHYEWVVVQRPEGSTANPVEEFIDPFNPADGGPVDDQESPKAQFFADLAGEYVIELRVTDRLGATAPSALCPQNSARVTLTVVPEEDIHLQLVWDTPGDDDQTDNMGTDFDLHFLPPHSTEWFEGARDCYFGNQTPDWGVPGRQDDNPSLDLDDTNGAGPENINLDHPVDTDESGDEYRIGVHYFQDTGGLHADEAYGASTVTVRVYLGGELAAELHRELSEINSFWRVARVAWGAERGVVPIDRVEHIDPR